MTKTNKEILVSCKSDVDSLKYIAENINKRIEELYKCSDICDNEKLTVFWKCISDAVHKADEAWRMGMRSDN